MFLKLPLTVESVFNGVQHFTYLTIRTCASLFHLHFCFYYINDYLQMYIHNGGVSMWSTCLYTDIHQFDIWSSSLRVYTCNRNLTILPSILRRLYGIGEKHTHTTNMKKAFIYMMKITVCVDIKFWKYYAILSAVMSMNHAGNSKFNIFSQYNMMF